MRTFASFEPFEKCGWADAARAADHADDLYTVGDRPIEDQIGRLDQNPRLGSRSVRRGPASGKWRRISIRASSRRRILSAAASLTLLRSSQIPIKSRLACRLWRISATPDPNPSQLRSALAARPQE